MDTAPGHPTWVLALRGVRVGVKGAQDLRCPPEHRGPAGEAPGSPQQPCSRGRARLIRAAAGRPTCL